MIPRGVRFRVELPDGQARGYVCENYGAPFRLPDLGPIGSNGLANPRDFLTPVAAYEDVDGRTELVAKFMGHLWARRASTIRRSTSSPGTATTRRTSTTCAASTPSARSASTTRTRRSSSCCTRQRTRRASANIDFVIFPPRLLVAAGHLPPALVPPQRGERVHGPGARRLRRQGRGLRARRRSLHNSMSGHGPDAETFEKASRADLSKPRRDPRHHGVHVRDAARAAADRATRSKPPSCSATTTAAGRACRSTSTRSSHERRPLDRRDPRPGAAKLGRIGQRPGRPTSRSRTCRSAASARADDRTGASAWRSATRCSTCAAPGLVDTARHATG